MCFIVAIIIILSWGGVYVCVCAHERARVHANMVHTCREQRLTAQVSSSVHLMF